jgi:putative intracellular protease/amidase
MSGNLNVTRPERKKKVLIVAANPATSPQTGWPVGFWWSELTHPFLAFTEAGYEVEIRSPKGGALVADGYSDPEDSSGYSSADFVSLGFKHSPQHAGLLTNTASIEGVSPDDYDALFVAGGQSPMITFPQEVALQTLVASFYEAGKIVALVCHATCLLLHTRDSKGELIAKGRTWTGFADSEEAYADAFVGQRIQPFWIESEARKVPGTNFIVDQMFRPFAVRDGNLVTGQQQFSGAETARLVIEALGR